MELFIAVFIAFVFLIIACAIWIVSGTYKIIKRLRAFEETIMKTELAAIRLYNFILEETNKYYEHINKIIDNVK